jgi:ketosteroid isomerase-like protein
MPRIIFLAALMTIPGLAQQAVEQEVIAADRQWMSALERKDRATLDRMLADEYTLADLSGISSEPPVAKTQWLQNAIHYDWHDLKFRSITAKVYGDVAVVTGTLHFGLKGRGIPMSSDTEIVDVWAKRNGQWQVTMRRVGAYSLFDTLRWVGGFLLAVATGLFYLLGLRIAKRKRLTTQAP